MIRLRRGWPAEFSGTVKARGQETDQKELAASFRKLGAPDPEGWARSQVDDDGNILGFIGGLHESVLETDPNGRGMRPRPGSAG